MCKREGEGKEREGGRERDREREKKKGREIEGKRALPWCWHCFAARPWRPAWRRRRRNKLLQDETNILFCSTLYSIII